MYWNCINSLQISRIIGGILKCFAKIGVPLFFMIFGFFSLYGSKLMIDKDKIIKKNLPYFKYNSWSCDILFYFSLRIVLFNIKKQTIGRTEKIYYCG